MKKTFIQAENVLKECLNKSVRGFHAREHKQTTNTALNEFLLFGGVTTKRLRGLILNSSNPRLKLNRVLSNNPKIQINEILQEDKPRREDYLKNVSIMEYGLNKWGEVVLKDCRVEQVVSSRLRFPKRFLKVVSLID